MKTETDTLRVLLLDTEPIPPSATRELGWCNVELEVTPLEVSKIERRGGFRVSIQGLRLARTAAHQYDAVIIGDNNGTGLSYARELPESLRGTQTLILWWMFPPEENEMESYLSLGYRHLAGHGSTSHLAWLRLQVAVMRELPQASSR